MPYWDLPLISPKLSQKTERLAPGNAALTHLQAGLKRHTAVEPSRHRARSGEHKPDCRRPPMLADRPGRSVPGRLRGWSRTPARFPGSIRGHRDALQC